MDEYLAMIIARFLYMKVNKCNLSNHSFEGTNVLAAFYQCLLYYLCFCSVISHNILT